MFPFRCAEGNFTTSQQVPAATGLTLRVINNVVKKMDTKSKFYDAFRKDGYPANFEYKQKARAVCLLSPAHAKSTGLLPCA